MTQSAFFSKGWQRPLELGTCTFVPNDLHDQPICTTVPTPGTPTLPAVTPMDENGNYSPELGIEKIRKYASLFGLDETSGIEIAEREPQMTTEKPEASSIGQGKNSYSNVQLSRYITAVANKEQVFN